MHQARLDPRERRPATTSRTRTQRPSPDPRSADAGHRGHRSQRHVDDGHSGARVDARRGRARERRARRHRRAVPRNPQQTCRWRRRELVEDRRTREAGRQGDAQPPVRLLRGLSRSPYTPGHFACVLARAAGCRVLLLQRQRRDYSRVVPRQGKASRVPGGPRGSVAGYVQGPPGRPRPLPRRAGHRRHRHHGLPADHPQAHRGARRRTRRRRGHGRRSAVGSGLRLGVSVRGMAQRRRRTGPALWLDPRNRFCRKAIPAKAPAQATPAPAPVHRLQSAHGCQPTGRSHCRRCRP